MQRPKSVLALNKRVIGISGSNKYRTNYQRSAYIIQIPLDATSG